MAATTARLKARLGLTDSLSSSEDGHQGPDSNVKSAAGLVIQADSDVGRKGIDDYYDSINHHRQHHPQNRRLNLTPFFRLRPHLNFLSATDSLLKRSKSRSTNGSSSVSGPYSPLDSLERSLPSVGITYHYRPRSVSSTGSSQAPTPTGGGMALKRSSYYATTSGSSADNSTTPSNSLGIN